MCARIASRMSQPVVGGGWHVAQQLVPLGDLVTCLARAGPDRAGVEAADVGEDGGDFTSFHGELLRSSRFVECREQSGGVRLSAGHADRR